MAKEEETTVDRLVIYLEAERQTKSTVVYREIPPIGDDEVLKVQYVQKGAIKRLGGPERIKITIEPDDDNPAPRGWSNT